MFKKIFQPRYLWISIWFFLNIALTLLNKGVMHFYHFRFPILLSFVHQSSSALLSQIIYFTHLNKYFEESEKSSIVNKQHEKAITKRVALLSVLFSFNIIFGNLSLHLCSVAFVQTVRAIIPMITMFLSILFLHSQYTMAHYLSCGVVCIGVGLSCFGEINLTILGFFITIFVCILSSCKSISIKMSLSGPYQLSSFNLLQRISPISAIEMFLLSLLFKEPQKLLDSQQYVPTLTSTLVIFSTGFIAYFLNLTNFLATHHTSPLTITIMGCVKQVVTIFLSVLIFDKHITLLNSFGILITALGSLWYGLLKFRKPKSQANLLQENSENSSSNEPLLENEEETK